MSVDYEKTVLDINLIHDVGTLEEIEKYNKRIRNLFYSLIIENTKKPIFECCREYMAYLKQLDNVISVQIEDTINDMIRCDVDEDDIINED